MGPSVAPSFDAPPRPGPAMPSREGPPRTSEEDVPGTWEELDGLSPRCGLHDAIWRGLRPSPLQWKCIPLGLAGHDVLCSAPAGPDKRTAYVITCLQQLQDYDAPAARALVVCSSREDAFEVGEEFRRLARYSPGVEVGVMYGGRPIAEDRKMLIEKGPQILVASPGRLLAHLRESTIRLHERMLFILDACDLLLGPADMRRDVQTIYNYMPNETQVLMFGATFSSELQGLCKAFMHSTFHVVHFNGGDDTAEVLPVPAGSCLKGKRAGFRCSVCKEKFEKLGPCKKHTMSEHDGEDAKVEKIRIGEGEEDSEPTYGPFNPWRLV